MHTHWFCWSLFAIVGLVTPGIQTASGAPAAVRQYYSEWQKNTKDNYFYRELYYKPTTDYDGFKHHMVVFFPAKPQHLYFYNPYKKVYWGRCPSEQSGPGTYSLLREADRRGLVSEIPETAFPRPGALPPLPDATDGVKLDLPPDDLPTDTLPPG